MGTIHDEYPRAFARFIGTDHAFAFWKARVALYAVLRALGSRYRGRLLGTLGLAAYFSFQWNKPYTSGLGGMAVTSDESLAADFFKGMSAVQCRAGLSKIIAVERNISHRKRMARLYD